MTNEEFIQAINKFKFYIKPALFTVLAGNADVFSDDTKKEIIAKLMEADAQVQEIHDYQEKRNTILQRGIDKIDEIYSGIKMKFQAEGTVEEVTDSAKAEKLISNL